MKNLSRAFMPISLGVLISACGGKPEGAQWGAGGPQPYPVAAVATANATLNEDYPAVIEGQQNIEIRPKVDGFIEKIYVDEGSFVKKGQILFQINAPQYEQEARSATAAIRNAEAAVSTAKLQVAKAEPLVTKGIVNQYELDEAKLNLQAREATLSQARASLVNANVNVGYTTIVSPIDGVIGTIPYKTGSLVSSASPQPLTTVSDIRRLYAYFSLNEKQFLDFADKSGGTTLNQKIKQFPPVSMILANGTEYTGKGKLETIGGLINTSTGAVTLRAGFENPDALIRSGSSATIRIRSEIGSTIQVPQSATYEVQDKKFVYLVDKSGAVKSREIHVRPVSYGQNYVVDSGLVAGDQIVLDGMGNLSDGMKIIPTDPAKMAAGGQQHH